MEQVSKALKLDPAHLEAWHALGDLSREGPGASCHALDLSPMTFFQRANVDEFHGH